MTTKHPARPATVAEIETEIQRIQSVCLDDLRSQWREVFKKDVPKALTRDLMVRMLTRHIQERAFGGHDRATLNILDSHAKGRPGDAQRTRYLKTGTEIV